ncbi:MAG TPA: hypothetical protein VH414_15830 [Lichenihabitans sp.]|jgi:DNA-binding CsgD family transcriptional regulator|nr:hypothetical protein [Lichenihabitans sp.]
MHSDPLVQIDALLQSAALDPTRWPAALDGIAELSGAQGAFILPLRGRTPSAPCTQSAAEQLHFYFAEGWARRDHRYHGVAKMLRTGTMVDQDFTTPDQMDRSPYYRDYLGRFGLRWFAGLGFKAATETWCLALQRSADQGFFDPHEEHGLLRLQGILSRAAALAVQVSHIRIEGRADVFDALAGAAFLLDRFGRVIRSTPAAQALVGQGIRLFDGCLASRIPAETIALKRLVQAALWSRVRPDSPDLSPVILRRPDLRPLVVQAQPLRAQACDIFESATVLLLVTDLSAKPRGAASVLQQAFRLTGPECRIANALISTFDLRTAAEMVGIGYETARTHFKMVLAKTNTRNQGEFLSLAARLVASGQAEA